MGALTLKSFPFEIRGWDIEKFESFDPTDGFGSNTRVYISKNQIVQIEPDYNNYNFNIWLTDKGRQFFDAIFKIWHVDTKVIVKNKFWFKLFHKIIKTIYIFDHSSKQKSQYYFFVIVCNNLSFEILSILIFISQSYSFIKLRKIESSKVNTDLESDFQLNNSLKKTQLNLSTLCLLIATNSRYEGYHLNLSLRQRIFKGNFKCLLIGSLTDLTFPVSFLGSNTKILKTILEGNNFVCQDLKSSKRPILIYNNELFQRNDSENIIKNIQLLYYSTIINKIWNGLNLLSPSLSETTFFNLKQVSKLTFADLNNFSSLYFLNVTTGNFSNIKKITELKIMKQSFLTSDLVLKNILSLDQNNKFSQNYKFLEKMLTNYSYIPSSMFYENEDIYINTEGFLRLTTKLISDKKTRNSWQILRKLLKLFHNKWTFLIQKENRIVFYNSQKFYNFKNFMTFQYYPTQVLSNINFYLTVKNKSIVLKKVFLNFKERTKKLIYTKLKYWLDDFFNGSKDEYSRNSIVLTNCSKALRLKSTNFY